MLALIIRNKFRFTSRAAADHTIRKEARLTLTLARSLPTELVEKPIHVPKMIGIDEDMRDWSICETLAHNVIVNQNITKIVRSLSVEQRIITNFDPKIDVMPTAGADISQIEAFEKSVSDHMTATREIESMLSQMIFPHPIFGNFNAHQWHCMFGFHLMLHRRQIEKGITLLERN